MRRWSADRIVLCSLVILALVLPAAPAVAEGAVPDCDKTWTPDPYGDYSADTPANWSPAEVPIATDIVCLPAETEYGNYVYGGTITAAELHILSDSAQIDGATNLQVPVIHSTATAGGLVDLTWVNLSGVTTLASGRVQIGSVDQLGYEGVTSTFEVLESATLTVTVNSYQSTTRPLTVYGELNFVNAVDWSTWVGFSAPLNIPGTLRLSSPEWYQDRLGCAGCAEYGLTFYSGSTTNIAGSVVVDDGRLDLSNTNLTVGQDAVAPVTVEDGRTVLNGPAGGYVVSNAGLLTLAGDTQIQQLNTDLTLEGTGAVGVMSGGTVQSTLATLDTVRAGASLTLRDIPDLYELYNWGGNGRRGAALTTTVPLTNLGGVTVGPSSTLTTAGYTQAVPQASTDLVFGAAKGNPKLVAAGPVELSDGAVHLTVPADRAVIPGSLSLVTGSSLTRTSAVTTAGVPADTDRYLYSAQVNQEGTELQFVTDAAELDGEESRDVSAITAYNGHYYELMPATGSWIDAKNEAAASSYLHSTGHLVTISSAGENAFVNDSVTADGGAGYIGFEDQANEGAFRWVTGESVAFTAWAYREPNNAGEEDCTVQYVYGQWNDTICASPAASHFLVEYDGPYHLDTDGDGVSDRQDAFPNDADETADADGDGVGDNGDAFPNDPDESVDADGDGVGDNADAFPNDPDESADADGDGVGDNAEAADTTPPANPAVSASHTGAWSADPIVTATFSEVGDDVAGYAVVWDGASDTMPAATRTQSVDSATTSSGVLPSGTHYLHVRTEDTAGNWSDVAHAGPFNIDAAAPGRASVLAPETSLLAQARNVEVSWAAATDAHSGISGYTVEHSRTPFGPGAVAGFAAGPTTTTLSAPVDLELGARNCLRVVSSDLVGRQSRSAARCINVPFAATQFNASADDGWYELHRRKFAFGAAMVTYDQGARLHRQVSAHRIGIRAIVCPSCGDVALRWAGEAAPFARIDLRGELTGAPAVLMAPAFPARTSGTLIVEVASTNRRIAIDSIIVK